MDAAMREVTVPVDSSASSRRGVAYALELGRKGAILHFCSVVDATAAYLGGAVGAPIDAAPIIQAMALDAQETCDDAVGAARSAGIAADGKVIYGSVVQAIGRYAREQNSSALVIGTHARSGAPRAILGSIAESLMQASTVPIVVTHADDAVGSGPITVAIDGTPASDGALQIAIGLARDQKRSLSILTVVAGGRRSWFDAQAILSDAGDLARLAGIGFETVTVEGHVPDTIIASAQRADSPMIVIGTNGRSDLARMLLGSVAAAVVERAHVPVTVVHQ
jgi:nucleotide-binding universal stress UspA family protein